MIKINLNDGHANYWRYVIFILFFLKYCWHASMIMYWISLVYTFEWANQGQWFNKADSKLNYEIVFFFVNEKVKKKKGAFIDRYEMMILFFVTRFTKTRLWSRRIIISLAFIEIYWQRLSVHISLLGWGSKYLHW